MHFDNKQSSKPHSKTLTPRRRFSTLSMLKILNKTLLIEGTKQNKYKYKEPFEKTNSKLTKQLRLTLLKSTHQQRLDNLSRIIQK